MLCPTSGVFLDCFSDVLYALAHPSTIPTRSQTVQKVFVTPAAIAGVQRIATARFSFAEVRRFPDELIKLLKYLALVVNQMFRKPHHVHEQDMGAISR
jgi:hypothetical protein